MNIPRRRLRYFGMKTRVMHRLILTFTCFLLLFSGLAQGQTERPARVPANKDSRPTTYPVNTPVRSEALQQFVAYFQPQDVGFFHVYADPAVDPVETYLLRGREMSDVAVEMLPKKYQRKARRMDADVYAAGAIRGMDENMFIVRMDGPSQDRIELFAIRGDAVKHLRTLAKMKRSGSRLKQTDSYITDINGDSYLDIMTVKRNRRGEIGKRRVYVLDPTTREYVRTRKLNAPWESVKLFDPPATK